MSSETVVRRGCRFGTHRVLEPAGALPQAAWRLDATPIAYDNEVLCDVDVLNLDSASFRQICEACNHDAADVAEHVAGIVRHRGKQHKPVTGSGGMFVGRIREIGPALRERVAAKTGDRIASESVTRGVRGADVTVLEIH